MSTYEEIKIWDIETGKCLKTIVGHIDSIETIEYSKDGKILISGSKDKLIKIWDIKTEKQIAMLKGHTRGVLALKFSPSGKYIASSGDDGTIKLWDLKAEKEIRTFLGHEDSVYNISFSLCGKFIASASDDRTIKLWDVKTGENIKTFRGHKLRVTCVKFAGLGRYLISGSFDNTIKIWEVDSGKEIANINAHKDSISTLAVSPDGRYLTTGSFDKTIKKWKLVHFGDVIFHPSYPVEYLLASRKSLREETKNKTAFEELLAGAEELLKEKEWEKAHNELRKALSIPGYSKENKALSNMAIAGKYASRVGLNNSWCSKIIRDYTESVKSVAFPKIKRYFISCSENTLQLWDFIYGDLLRIYKSGKTTLRAGDISPCASFIVAGGEDKVLRIWNVNTGDLKKILLGHGARVNDVAFSPCSKYIISGSEDEAVKLWDVTTGKTLRTYQGHIGSVSCVSFSPRGRTFLSGSVDKTIKLWDFSTQKPLKTFSGHTGAVETAIFSYSGNYILSGGIDRVIKLWDVKKGELIKEFEGHSSSVDALAFSSCDEYFISGGVDKTIKIWERKSGKNIKTFAGHTDSVMSLAFSPCGRYFISGSMDETIRVWEIDWKWDFSKPVIREIDEEIDLDSRPTATLEKEKKISASSEDVDEKEMQAAFLALTQEVARLHKEAIEASTGELQIRSKCRIIKRDKIASFLKMKKLLSTCWETKQIHSREIIPPEEKLAPAEGEDNKFTEKELISKVTNQLLGELLGSDYKLQEEGEDFVKNLIGTGILKHLASKVIRGIDEDNLPDDISTEDLSAKASEKLAKELYNAIVGE